LDCIILGNSGSLLETPRQEDWQWADHTIGVNRILRPGIDGRTYLPDDLFFDDVRVRFSDAHLINQTTCRVVVNQDVVHKPMELVRASRLMTGLRGKPPPPLHPNNMWTFELSPWYTEKDDGKCILHLFPKTDTDPIHSACNISFAAIQWAVVSGAKRVLLLGVDNAWIGGRHTHFYNRGELGEKVQPMQVTQQFPGKWNNLKKWTEQRGVEVRNGSPWATITTGHVPFDPIDSERVLLEGVWR
jgi:hypothetical protein